MFGTAGDLTFELHGLRGRVRVITCQSRGFTDAACTPTST